MNLFIGVSSKECLEYDDDYKKLITNIASCPDIDLVFGGCDVGIIKRCIDSFKDNGKKVIAVTVDKYKEQLNNINYDCKYIMKNTIERTNKTYELADVMLMLPGGIGSFAELFSFMEEMRTNDNEKMLILYNKDLYYTNIIEKMYKAYEEKLIDYPPSEYMLISNDIDEIVEVIKNY